MRERLDEARRELDKNRRQPRRGVGMGGKDEAIEGLRGARMSAANSATR